MGPTRNRLCVCVRSIAGSETFYSTVWREHFRGFEDSVRWTRPRGGLYVWSMVPDGVDTGPEGPFFPEVPGAGVVRNQGVRLRRGPGTVPRNHGRLCFGVPGEVEFEEGCDAWRSRWRECRAGRLSEGTVSRGDWHAARSPEILGDEEVLPVPVAN